MTHVEQGELQAYLDGEVSAGSRAAIESHMHSCADCAAELAALRSAARLFATAMHSVDAPPAMQPARAAVSAARSRVVRRRFAFSRDALARAAMFLVAFAAIASAAIPGSPVRAWIIGALRSTGIVSAPAPKPDVARTPSAAPVAPAAEASLSIEPADGRVRIVLTGVAPEGLIRVRLVDSDRAVVQAGRGAAHARFRTGPGRIEVVGVGKGEVSIDLPRSVTDARVDVDGRVLFQKDHDRIVATQSSSANGSGSEFVFKAGH